VALLAAFADVQVIVTSSARHFFDNPLPTSSTSASGNGNTSNGTTTLPTSLLDGSVPVLADSVSLVSYFTLYPIMITD
jgi:hypothetical protein